MKDQKTKYEIVDYSATGNKGTEIEVPSILRITNGKQSFDVVFDKKSGGLEIRSDGQLSVLPLVSNTILIKSKAFG